MHLSRSYFLGSTILAGAIAFAAPSFAQQTPAPATPPENRASADGTTEVEEVVVTGSRIKSSNFTSTSPVQVITSDQTDLRGIPDAAQALLTSTLAAGSFQINDQLTGYNTEGGGGTQALALRGLGAQRTLTLMNGKRAGPAGVRGQVQAFDLNVIPQAQVDRFDILKDGASSIYGSDAVAGVVNIITKRNLNGGSVNVYGSFPLDTGGDQYRADVTYGKVFDSGYFSASAEYYVAKILKRKDRDQTACAADYVFDPVSGARRDYIDPRTGQIQCLNQANGYVSTQSGSATLGNAINLVPTIPGFVYPTTANGNTNGLALTSPNFGPPPAGFARFARSGYPQTFGYFPGDTPLYDNASVISPVERTTLNFTGGFFVSPKLELYTELLYSHRISSQIGSASIFPGSFGFRNLAPFNALNTFPASNPNNPFGVNVRTVTAYASNNNQTVDYYRGVVGMRGDIGLLGRDWSYDLYGQYSLSDGTYDLGDRLYLDRWLATVSPNVRCTDTPAGGNFSGFNCSALPQGVPWASPRVLSGQFTQAERDFLFFREESSTTYSHAYIEGSASTRQLFTVPAGDVGAAVGFQVRREALNDLPGYQARNQNVGLVSTAQQTKGDDTISELFGELEIPIAKDVSIGKSVDLNLSGRISDYKSYGVSKTYKVGLNWKLTDEYRMRFSTGTSFRAPALYELYLGTQNGFLAQSSVDPCYLYGTSGVDAQIQTACAALGIAADYNASGSSSATVASIGGAGRLEAETAKTYNFGIVWTPSYLPLSVAVDYFAITINDEVSQFGGYTIVEKCLQGNADFCSLFIRDPASKNITNINDSYVNLNEQQNRGIDLQVRYRHAAPFNLGDLTVESQHTWKIEDKINLLGGTTDDYLGLTFRYAGPAYAGNFYTTLDKGPWTVFYGIDMIGKGSNNTVLGPPVQFSNKFADLNAGRNSPNCAAPPSINYCVFNKLYTEFVAYHSTSLRYRKDGYSLQVGVQNLFDRQPPEMSVIDSFRIGTSALNGYEMRGRRGFVRIGKTF